MDADEVEARLDKADDERKRAKVEDGTATETLVPKTYIILSTPELRAANAWAVRLNQNRSLTDSFVASLDPDGTHIVGFTLDHTNYEGTPGMRCQIYCKVSGDDEPVEAWLDMRHEDYRALQRIEIAEKP